ncbi:MAG: competence/damage-inducible protein A, partial [Proteiniphilum sp.]|nr:competence/damage-inducible protein A [Proteiniphilum sp.]
MLVEIITIGDEILIGQITDTNSTWMAAQLTKLGFEVVAISSVADQKDSITKAIDIAFSRADILLLTGGIGPTKDDITKNTLCSYFNTDLIFDEAVLQNINEIFWRRKYTLNELTRSQAMVPRGSTVIQNRAGTAPIIWFEKNDKILVSMPGVPSEMKTAMSNDILPKLVNQFNVDNYLSTTLSVSGITESDLAIRLNDFENRLPYYTNLAYLPAYGIIRLRLSLRNRRSGDNLNELTNELKQLVKPFLIDDE